MLKQRKKDKQKQLQEYNTVDIEETKARLKRLLYEEVNPLREEYLKTLKEFKQAHENVELNEYVMKEFEEDYPNNPKDYTERQAALKETKDKRSKLQDKLQGLDNELKELSGCELLTVDEYNYYMQLVDTRNELDQQLFNELEELYSKIDKIKNNELVELRHLNNQVTILNNLVGSIKKASKHKTLKPNINTVKHDLKTVKLIKQQ